jgi:signal transduction histidine kinase/DNA-binding response OmpR family regulator
LFFFGVSAQSQSLKDGLHLLEKAEKFNNEKTWDSAYSAAKDGLKIFKDLKNDSLIAKAAIQLVYTTENINYSEQADFYKLAKAKASQLKNPELLAEAYYTKGQALFNNKEMGKAQPYFLKVDSLANRYHFLTENVVKSVITRSEISRRTFTPEGVEQAHDLQLQAMKLAKKLNSDELINDLYLRLADMNGLIENLPKAKKYLDSAYVYFKKTDNTEQLSWWYLTYMNYYYGIEDYDSGGKKLKEGIAYLSTKNHPEQLASMLTAYGTFFRKRKKDCAKALVQFKKAKAIYDSIDLKLNNRYMYLMEGMGLCYAEMGNFEDSYKFYQKAYETKRDLTNKANNDLTRKLETKYQTEKKEQEIALLTSEKKLVEQQKKNQRNLLYGILALIAIGGTFVFFQLKNRQKTNKKLKELDRAKSTFFANISHEFRTPLTLINGPIEDQLSSEKISPGQRKNLNTALRNTQRLKDLVDQLLALSKLESGNLKLNIQQGNMPQFIISQAAFFTFSCNENNIDYNVEVEKDDNDDWFDQDVLEKMLYNLIGNAIKYTPEKGRIIVKGKRTQKNYEISVLNSGNFLPIDQREKIFERFYQTDTKNPGTGIGLALTKELAEIHKGSISIKSEENGFTEFKIMLPTNKDAFDASEIFTENIEKNIYKTIPPLENTIEKEVVSAQDAPVILVVDDNKDIRDYVSSIFDTTYIVYTAHNGTDGFASAMEHVPDIILSDVMMPEEDGYSLTKRLKENPLTSHIPIILLTAKTHITSKLEGMGIGADAYVTKPFNSQLLKATVENLIENRRKLQERFAQEVILTPKEIAVSSADEQFLERLQKVLDEHLTKPDFSAELFGNEMGVSRMQLHRKLKALTGQSTTEFIRSQRLKLAAKLLKSDKISISEVGYLVGFNDPSYFTRCFKQEFGCSPSGFISQ